MNKRKIILSLLILFMFAIVLPSTAKTTNLFLNGNKDFPRTVPAGYKIKKAKMVSKKSPGAEIKIYAQTFRQGDAAYIEFIPEKEGTISNVKMEYIGYERIVTKTAWGWRAFTALHPQTKPGTKYIKYTYDFDGETITKWINFTVYERKFHVSKYALQLGRYSNVKPLPQKTIKYIQECTKLRKDAFKTKENDRITSTVFHPRDMHKITSPFWAKRIYSKYKVVNGKRQYLKPRVKHHRGLDLKGLTGAPVYAMMTGKVVLSAKLYYEGNMVLINHGAGVFSYYLHLSERFVKTGDIVKAGTLIAKCGATGSVTGPHLHVSTTFYGVQADPMTLLSLPIR